MSDTLYLCPCCNKLVPGSHFKRAPWTLEDIIELTLHPRLEKRIRHLIQQELDLAPQPRMDMAAVRTPPKAKAAPPGWLTYKEACARTGISMQVLRGYVHRKRIKGGGGLVRVASLKKFMTTYRPRKKGARPI